MSTSQGDVKTSETDLEQRSRRLRDRLSKEYGFGEQLLLRVLDRILGADPKYKQTLADEAQPLRNPCRYLELTTNSDSLTAEQAAWMWYLNMATALPSKLLSMILEEAQAIETKS